MIGETLTSLSCTLWKNPRSRDSWWIPKGKACPWSLLASKSDISKRMPKGSKVGNWPAYSEKRRPPKNHSSSGQKASLYFSAIFGQKNDVFLNYFLQKKMFFAKSDVFCKKSKTFKNTKKTMFFAPFVQKSFFGVFEGFLNFL